MRKITLILFYVISLCVNLIAQSLDFTKDGRHYYIASPNGRYFTGTVNEGPGCFFDVATGNHYTTDEDSVLIFAVNNDGIACGALVGKPGVWVRGEEWKMLTALESINGKPVTGGEIIGMSEDATKFITLMYYDGKSIPVYFELNDFENWDNKEAWDFSALPIPTKEDLLYHMDPAFVQVCGMNYDGTRILGRYRLVDGKREVPFIWQKTANNDWTIKFLIERCLFIDDVLNGTISIPDRSGSDNVTEYDLFRESVEKGIIFDLSPFKVVAWTGSGRYIPVCANVLDKDGFGSNYAAVIDVDKDTLIVFTAVPNAGTVSVNDKGEVMIYTPNLSNFRDSYVATIDNPTEAVSLLEYTRQRTNGAIDLAEYMTYQINEDFDGNPVYSTLTGSAVWANEGNAFVTYNYDGWNETLVPQCFFVNFEEDNDDDGEKEGNDGVENIVKRKVLLEIFSTENDSYSPKGQEIIKSSINGRYEEIIEVNHHVGFFTDQWTLLDDTIYEDFYHSAIVTSFSPGGMIDRTLFTKADGHKNPFQGGDSCVVFSVCEADVLNMLNVQLAKPAYAWIDLDAIFNENDSILTIKASGKSVTNLLGDSRLTIYVTEDSLLSYKQAGWNSDSNGPYYQNNVNRFIVTDVWGDQVTLNEGFEKEYKVKVQPNWNVDNLNVVAFVHNYSTKPNEKERYTDFNVYNAEKVKITMVDTEKVNENFALYVASENPEMGGVKIILVAEAIEGFEFVEWSDGNIANPRIIELTEDTELYARFRIESEITNVETSKISVAEVYSRDGVLYVEGAESDYHVLDMAGRLIYSGRQSALNLPRGVYLVTIAGEVEKVVL